ncbi:hypothetical protein GOBAR_AA28947 [Gossypium barbadense]|uniref:Leucine-rich repeat-containing N-terminal plant-type domain-containing protein n=1 Tax=Gossypium barbadense TaxID=3634 RepID=A0A2P5WKX5_GOSBA|nr:hypothetical protein GOBAR_AA28947 [Gossypium barbadense]
MVVSGEAPDWVTVADLAKNSHPVISFPHLSSFPLHAHLSLVGFLLSSQQVHCNGGKSMMGLYTSWQLLHLDGSPPAYIGVGFSSENSVLEVHYFRFPLNDQYLSDFGSIKVEGLATLWRLGSLHQSNQNEKKMERLISVCLWLILALHLVLRVAGNAEGDALNALKNNLTDPNNLLQDWDPTDTNPCQCDLGNANLSGKLVPDLGMLSNLQYL